MNKQPLLMVTTSILLLTLLVSCANPDSTSNANTFLAPSIGSQPPLSIELPSTLTPEPMPTPETTPTSESMPTLTTSNPRHAPNMYVGWSANGDYDVMTIDWYCEQDAENTYWAVHNWDIGYAGFQNKDGEHILLLSLWDLDDAITPTIEYSKDGIGGTFDGEGTGKQVFTNYEWQTGKWYSMRVQVWTDAGKSYFGQWICEDGGVWEKTAVISYPVAELRFHVDLMFQEDFVFNNLPRKCRLKNAYGRFYGTTNWDSWNEFYISNTYFPTFPPTWEDVLWNINYDCDWGIDSSNSYVWVLSGGGDFTPNEKTAPVVYTISQDAVPFNPNWIN